MLTAYVRYLLIPTFCAVTGYTLKAVERKRQDGIWVEGKVWHKAPDGHVMMDMEGFNKWVRGDKVVA